MVLRYLTAATGTDHTWRLAGRDVQPDMLQHAASAVREVELRNFDQ